MWHQRQIKCINLGQPAASLKENRGSLAYVCEDAAAEGGGKDGDYRGGGGIKKETAWSWFSQVAEHNVEGLSTLTASPD